MRRFPAARTPSVATSGAPYEWPSAATGAAAPAAVAALGINRLGDPERNHA